MRRKFLIRFFLFVYAFIGNCRAQEPSLSNTDLKEATKFLKSHNYFQTIYLCNKNLNVGLEKKSSESHAMFLSIKGIAYLDTISADSGKYFLENSLSEALKVNYKTAICNSLHGLGKYYYRNGVYKTSIKYFNLLEHYAVLSSDKSYLLIANYYLSSNYNFLNASELSVKYCRKSAELAAELKDTTSYIKSMIGIADQYLVALKSDSANYYYLIANSVFLKYSKKESGIGVDIYNSLSKTNMIEKNFDKAIYYGKLAINDCIKYNYIPNLNIYYENVSICYTNKKMYDSAICYLEKALVLAKKYNYVDEYKEDLKELYSIYKTIGKVDKALPYMEEYFKADLLYRQDFSNQIDSLKTAFEVEKNALTFKSEKEKLQELNVQKQKYYLLIGIVSLLFAVLLFYFIYARYKLHKEKEKQNLMIQIKDSEIKALQAQINPHFIFNSLNSILEYIRKSEKEEAIVYLTKFAKLIRMVLELSNKKSVLLSDEIDLLRLYMELENFRFNNNFKCTINVQPSLDIYNIEIPSLIIQPFIENAILHGLQNKFSILSEQKKIFSGELVLDFSGNEQFIKCLIKDNGIGREKAEEIKKNKLFSHKSMGMRVTKNRLDLLSQNKCKIEFVDLKNAKGYSEGTQVEIVIPVSTEF